MGGKGGIVSTAVFGVKNQRYIENSCLQFSKLAVRTQNVEQVFRCGKLRLRAVDEKTVPIMIMAVSLVAVHRKHRE